MQGELRGCGKAEALVMHHRYCAWRLDGLQPAQALLQRATLHTHAKCYLQASLCFSAATPVTANPYRWWCSGDRGLGLGLGGTIQAAWHGRASAACGVWLSVHTGHSAICRQASSVENPRLQCHA